MIDFNEIELRAERLMKKRKSHLYREVGYIYYHGQRVGESAVCLRRLLTDDDRFDDALRIAGIFHDVCKGMSPHGPIGARFLRDLLSDLLPEDTLALVCRLVEVHSERQPNSDVHDLFAKILQDADLLDHFGTARVFIDIQYHARTEGSIFDVLQYEKTEFLDSARKERSLLNFPVSQKIFDERVAYQIAFFERAEREALGHFEQKQGA